MRDYELVLLVSPEVGDEGFPATVERVSQFIKDRGGEVKNLDPWGRRRLAYPIRRQTEGFYAVAQISLEPQAVRPLEGSLDLAEDILRHLVVRLDEVREPPAPRATSAPEVTEEPAAPEEEPAPEPEEPATEEEPPAPEE